MLTAEVKINGALLGHLYVHNTAQSVVSKGTTRHRYTAEWYEVASGVIKRSKFIHRREDGADVCVAKAFRSLGKRQAASWHPL